MSFESSYDGRSRTVIANIDTDEGVTLPFDEIDFSPYDNPNISIDSAGRFATHEIIGGTTVRQKIGEEQLEIQIDGVAQEREAIKVDLLRKAKLVTLLSSRLRTGSESGSLRCQVVSSSTDPLEDGGAADMDSGEFLYSYNINLVSIEIDS